MKEEGRDTLLRKRKVLHLLSQWSTLCTDLPRDDEHTKLFLKVRMERGEGIIFGNTKMPPPLQLLIMSCHIMRTRWREYCWLQRICKCPQTFSLSYPACILVQWCTQIWFTIPIYSLKCQSCVHFTFADSVQIRSGWSLWVSLAGEGPERTSETSTDAKETVSRLITTAEATHWVLLGLNDPFHVYNCFLGSLLLW